MNVYCILTFWLWYSGYGTAPLTRVKNRELRLKRAKECKVAAEKIEEFFTDESTVASERFEPGESGGGFEPVGELSHHLFLGNHNKMYHVTILFTLW